MNDRKQKFNKVYANLPSAARDEVIAVVEGEPYTWRSARIEVENDTKIASIILEHLERLGLLQ